VLREFDFRWMSGFALTGASSICCRTAGSDALGLDADAAQTLELVDIEETNKRGNFARA